MTEELFERKKDEIRSQMGQWEIESGEEVFSDYSIGYFYDAIEEKWKVYINNERGRHRIRLATSNKSEALEHLMSLALFIVENNKQV